MKKLNILYWIFTGLLVAIMLMSGVQNLLSTQPSVDLVSTKLGYPQYFIPFIGFAKTVGAIALLIPGYPRIKEWIYAGFVYDLTAATYSSIRIGEHFYQWGLMIIFFVLVAGSYICYHKKLKTTTAS
jgi:uncharacterized membrane protein YphA (DoxX/SURF4 family)